MVARELGDLERVEPTRTLDVDRVLLDDPTGSARQQDHAVAEAHGLAHVVGHEDHGEPRLAPQPLELVVQHVAGHGVERAERLVHEQDVGLLRERARQRHPLAHAAGELVRQLAPERGRGSRGRAVRRPSRCRSARGTLRIFSGSSTLPRAVSHGNSADSWNISVVRLRRRCRRCPCVGRSRPATRLSRVLFPQPDAPSRHTNSPWRDVEGDVVERVERVALRAEDLRDVVEGDRWTRGVLDHRGGRGLHELVGGRARSQLAGRSRSAPSRRSSALLRNDRS